MSWRSHVSKGHQRDHKGDEEDGVEGLADTLLACMHVQSLITFEDTFCLVFFSGVQVCMIMTAAFGEEMSMREVSRLCKAIPLLAYEGCPSMLF